MVELNSFRLSLLVLSAVAVYYSGYFDGVGQLRLPRNPVYSSVGSVASSCNAPGKFAITFDEGPGLYTDRVLEVLAETDTKATFHMQTKYLVEAELVVFAQNIRDQGHLIGLRFPAEYDPRNMTDDKLIAVLLDESERMYKYLGVYPRFLRLPWGQTNERVYNAVFSMGFIPTEWNVDPFDYYVNGTTSPLPLLDQLGSYIKPALASAVSGQGSFILLLHDYLPLYADKSLLREVVKWIIDAKYTPVTMQTCQGTPIKYRVSNADYRTGLPTYATPDAGSSSSSDSASPTATPISTKTSSANNLKVSALVACVVVLAQLLLVVV